MMRFARAERGVEAPVGLIAVLRLAGSAHEEAGHRRLRAIIWDVLDDGVARTTVCPIWERIAETPVVGSPKSRQQASHVPTSGDTRANSPTSSRLWRMSKPALPTDVISETV